MSVQQQPLYYEWGKVLTFGRRGNWTGYAISGWSEPEDGFTWTDTHNARISMGIKPPSADIALILNCAPFMSEGLVEVQELHLYVNFLRVAFVSISSERELTFEIPKDVFTRSRCDIDLYLPLARSPAELGINEDIRCLGLAVSRMILVQE